MKISIGEMAGQIWELINAKGPVTLTKLKTSIKADDLLLYSALGWLAREDKITIDNTGKSVKISVM